MLSETESASNMIIFIETISALYRKRAQSQRRFTSQPRGRLNVLVTPANYCALCNLLRMHWGQPIRWRIVPRPCCVDLPSRED